MPALSRVSRLAAAAGLLVLVCVAAAPARAQWSADHAFNLTIADRPDGQTQPKLAPTADGGFYVSWFGNGADGYDVYLQRLDALGTPLWAANGIRVADRSFSSTQDYGLAVDAAGHALLAYRVEEAGGVRVVANKVSPAGDVLWGAGVTVSAGEGAAPRIAGTDDGAAVVAWTSFVDGSIRVQKLDATGAPQWTAGGVTVPVPSGTFFIADLHADGAGAIVSGSAQLSFASRRLWAQKLGADGAPLWGAAPVEVFDGSDGALQLGSFPSFVPDGSGGAVFAWYQVSGASTTRIRVQHVLADGAFAFPQNGVDATAGTDRQRSSPSVATDGSSVFVAWPEELQVGGTRTYGVAAQRISDTGARLWGDGGVALVPLGPQQASQVVALPMGDGAVFAWALGSFPVPMRIDAARLDAAGAPVWPGGTVALKTAPTQNSRMQGALSTQGDAAYVWADGTGGAGEGAIKGQNVHPNGTLGITPVAAPEAPAPAFALRVAGANPVSGATTLAYALPEAASVRLEVFDALGRRVAVLADGAQAAGIQTATWDARGVPAGVYVARILAGSRAASAAFVVAN